MKNILKCKTCSIYTLKSPCPNCKEKTIIPRPPKYSPDDKYAKYRRETLRQERENKGLI